MPPTRTRGGRGGAKSRDADARTVRLSRRRCHHPLESRPDRRAHARQREAAHPDAHAHPGRHRPPRPHRRGGHHRGERGQAHPSPRGGRRPRAGRRLLRRLLHLDDALLQEGAPRRRPLHPRRQVRRLHHHTPSVHHAHHPGLGTGSKGGVITRPSACVRVGVGGID